VSFQAAVHRLRLCGFLVPCPSGRPSAALFSILALCNPLLSSLGYGFFFLFRLNLCAPPFYNILFPAVTATFSLQMKMHFSLKIFRDFDPILIFPPFRVLGLRLLCEGPTRVETTVHFQSFSLSFHKVLSYAGHDAKASFDFRFARVSQGMADFHKPPVLCFS